MPLLLAEKPTGAARVETLITGMVKDALNATL